MTSEPALAGRCKPSSKMTVFAGSEAAQRLCDVALPSEHSLAAANVGPPVRFAAGPIFVPGAAGVDLRGLGPVALARAKADMPQGVFSTSMIPSFPVDPA